MNQVIPKRFDNLEGGQPDYSWLRRLREGLVTKLNRFEKNLRTIHDAERIIEQAKKDNENGLPF